MFTNSTNSESSSAKEDEKKTSNNTDSDSTTDSNNNGEKTDTGNGENAIENPPELNMQKLPPGISAENMSLFSGLNSPNPVPKRIIYNSGDI